jgi:hypothetical protein
MRFLPRTAHRGFALLAALALAVPLTALLLLAASSMVCRADDGEDQSTDVAPPDLPAYDQPPIPGDGYAWTPGYWAWSDDDQDYYWVPGMWVLVPQAGYLWTPGYWAVETTVFFWHPGYWSAHVGFYGGICYGFGYGGHGFDGAYWRGGHLFYNRLAANLGNTPVPHVYAAPLPASTAPTSFNGGNGGVLARPDAGEQVAAHDIRLPPTFQQREQSTAARREVALRWTENQGVPPVAATLRPAEFYGAGVVAAKRAAPALNTDDASRPSAAARARRATQYPEPSASATAPGARTPSGASPSGAVRPSPEPREAPAEPRQPPAPRPPSEPRAPGEPHAPARPAERTPAEHTSPEHAQSRGH